MNKPLPKYWTAFQVSLRQQLVYPADFLAPLITFSLFVFIFSRIYTSALQGGQVLEGYTASQLVYYFLIAEMVIFGFGRLYSTLSYEVKSGQLVYALGRPYDFLRFQRAVLLGPAVVQTLLLGLVGWGIVLLHVGLPGSGSLLQVGSVLLSMGLSALISFALQASLSFSAFWLEENSALYWVYQKLALLVGTLMPLEFLPQALREIVWFTPFPWLAYAPARMAVAFDPDQALFLLGGQFVWLVIATALSRLLLTLGRRQVAQNGG